VISCDNLKANGRKLGDAVRLLATRRDPELAAWIAGEARFPATMVDAITPESDPPLRARVEARLGLRDLACVQREPFAQWAIEDDFAAGRPAWDRVGVELVASLKGHEALKLHVLNAAHSTLACLGPPRDFELVRQAIADPTLRRYLDAMIGEEVAPFLADQDVAGYWRGVSERLANPLIDHRLDQIARDMPVKLRERLHPVIIGNLRAGRPARRLCGVIAAWVAQQGRDLASALADPALFSDAFRRDGALRDGVLAAAA
jgi:fructuronate reductase